jgi:hypothetical protein
MELAPSVNGFTAVSLSAAAESAHGMVERISVSGDRKKQGNTPAPAGDPSAESAAQMDVAGGGASRKSRASADEGGVAPIHRAHGPISGRFHQLRLVQF